MAPCYGGNDKVLQLHTKKSLNFKQEGAFMFRCLVADAYTRAELEAVPLHMCILILKVIYLSVLLRL